MKETLVFSFDDIVFKKGAILDDKNTKKLKIKKFAYLKRD